MRTNIRWVGCALTDACSPWVVPTTSVQPLAMAGLALRKPPACRSSTRVLVVSAWACPCGSHPRVWSECGGAHVHWQRGIWMREESATHASVTVRGRREGGTHGRVSTWTMGALCGGGVRGESWREATHPVRVLTQQAQPAGHEHLQCIGVHRPCTTLLRRIAHHHPPAHPLAAAAARISLANPGERRRPLRDDRRVWRWRWMS